MSEIRKAVLRFATRRNFLLGSTSAVALGVLPLKARAFQRPGHDFGGGAAGSGPPPQTILSITLSPTTYTAGVANGVVGTVAVLMSNGNSPGPSGTLSITGTNSGGFHLSGTSSGASLLENSGGTTGVGPYSDFNIVYTQAGISNSPQQITPTVEQTAPLSFTLTNDGSSTQAAGVATQTIGLPFKQGDIASGNVPEFTVSSVAQPFSAGLQSYWTDGSLKFVSVMLLPTFSLAAGISQQITITPVSGSWPAASSRSLTEVYAQNLVVNAPPLAIADTSGYANGQQPGGGVAMHAWLNGDANTYNVSVWMDGAAGKIWRISTKMAATQGGSPDSFLRFDHYIAGLNNSSGGLAGFRWLGRMRMPSYAATNASNCNFFCQPPNSGSPTSGLNWQAAGTTYLPPWPFAAATDVTSNIAWSTTNGTISNGSGGAGNIFTTGSGLTGTISIDDNVAGAGIGGGAYIASQLTGPTGGQGTYSLGNIPGGGLHVGPELISSAGTFGSTQALSWITTNNNNLVPVQWSGSTISLLGTSTVIATGGCWWGEINNASPPGNFNFSATANLLAPVTPLNQVTGTATPVVGFTPFTSLIFDTVDAEYNYFQGSGSQAAETTLRSQINQTYWLSTRVLPPYTLNSTITGATFGGIITDTTYPFNRNFYNSLTIESNISGAGDSEFIGALTSFNLIEFYNQSKLSLKINRIVSHSASMMCSDFKDPTLDTAPNLTDVAYTGLSAPNTTTNLALSWDGNSQDAAGFTGPGPIDLPNGALFYAATDPSHVPFFNYYTYLRTGELQHYDLLCELALGYLLGTAARNPRAANGDSPYDANAIATYVIQENRATGWMLRTLAATAHVAPWNPSSPSTPDFDGTQRSKYFNDLTDANASFLIDCWNADPSSTFAPYATGANMWTQYNVNDNGNPVYWGNGPLWEQCYIGLGACYAALRNNGAVTTKALAFAELLITRMNYINTTYGGYYPCYGYGQSVVVNNTNQGPNGGYPLINADDQYVISQIFAMPSGPNWAPNSGGSTNAFTFPSVLPQGWQPANGDVLIPYEQNGPPYPPEMTQPGPWYIVGVNFAPGGGNYCSFNVSATRGGSPLAITSSGSTAILSYMPGPTNMPATATPYSGNFMWQCGYLTAWGTALGVSGGSAIITDIAARNTATGNPNSIHQLLFGDPYNTVDARYAWTDAY
jgi:hypothetical protein